MDLLRQVLVRLPLQRAFTLGNIINTREFIFTRLRVVNRISEDYLLEFPKIGDLLDCYVVLCDFQGELSDVTTIVISDNLVYSRAAFLQQEYWYQRAIFGLNIDLILASENLSIIIPALEASRDPYRIVDPEIVNWTPEIIAFYRRKILEIPGNLLANPMMRIAGYLHISPETLATSKRAPARKIFEYAEMYILSEMTHHSDPFAIIPTLDRFLKKLPIHMEGLAMIAISGGYFGFDFTRMTSQSVRIYATVYVQPKLLRSLPGRGSFNSIPVGLAITHHLVERAGEMISLVLEQYPNEIAYLMQMQALAGWTMDLKALHSLSESQKRSIVYIMRTVAHPQLTVELLRMVTDLSVGDTTVRYDLVNYFKQSQLLERPVATDHDPFLYATGQLLKCFRPDQMKDAVKGTILQ